MMFFISVLIFFVKHLRSTTWKDKPSQIYNCNESGMPLEHKLPCVVAIKGTKKVWQISSGSKTQITVLGCCSASGQVIPPMVLFSGKKFNLMI